MAENNRHSAGIGIFIRRMDKILIGRRGPACARGAGLFALPGGKLDHPETFPDCVRREAREETGLEVEIGGNWPPFSIPGVLAVTDHFDINQQVDGRLADYLSFWMICESRDGEPRVMEPDKCHGWHWVRPRDLLVEMGQSAENPTHPQHYWTPAPLWRRILRPYFGEM